MDIPAERAYVVPEASFRHPLVCANCGEPMRIIALTHKDVAGKRVRQMEGDVPAQP